MVLECYQKAMGKGWIEVVSFAKERVVDAGLPERVVHIYLESPQQRVISRMKNIVKTALANPVPSKSTSKPIYDGVLSDLKAQKMHYAEKCTPAERRVKHKLRAQFVESSSDTDNEIAQEPSKKKKKTDREVAREAQEAHKAMCSKALETMTRVNTFLSNVESQLKKGQQ